MVDFNLRTVLECRSPQFSPHRCGDAIQLAYSQCGGNQRTINNADPKVKCAIARQRLLHCFNKNSRHRLELRVSGQLAYWFQLKKDFAELTRPPPHRCTSKVAYDYHTALVSAS